MLTIKRYGLCALLLVLCSPAYCGESVRVSLSSKSNISTAEIANGFAKYCPSVVVTSNPDNASYVLEASKVVGADEGTTYSQWHFALMSKDGDILLATKPEFHLGNSYKHHFTSVCRFIAKR